MQQSANDLLFAPFLVCGLAVGILIIVLLGLYVAMMKLLIHHRPISYEIFGQQIHTPSSVEETPKEELSTNGLSLLFSRVDKILYLLKH
jgi:hypothetical protein